MSDSNPNSTTSQANSASEAALCCANFYEQDIVQELMGGSFHPGGTGLSRRLVTALNLTPKKTVLDVACGIGTTTRIMADEFGTNATGLDFSAINVQKAQAGTPLPAADPASLPSNPCCSPGESCCTPDQQGPLNNIGDVAYQDEPIPAGRLSFVQGSADALPFDADCFDGLTCECAVSTFADQPAVAAEFFRVLKPGGVFGMTDMVVNASLPNDFADKAAPWTCVAQALSVPGYQNLFKQAGFEVVTAEDHSHTLKDLATEMKRKLVMAGMSKALGALPSLGMDLPEMRRMLNQSIELVRAQTIQYAMLVFRKP